MDKHLRREIQQIALIQKKLDAAFGKKSLQVEQLSQIIDQLDRTNNSVTKIIDEVTSNKIKFDEKFLTTLNHELRTPRVPIRTCAELLLRGDFGALNPDQQKRLELIVSSALRVQQKIESLLNKSTFDTSVDSKTEYSLKETEQEKILLKKINQILENQIKQEDSEITELKKNLKSSEFQKREEEQEKTMLGKLVQVEEGKSRHLAKKNIIIIAIAALTMGVGFTAYSVYVVDLVGQQHRVSNLGNLQSNYVIQNLRGDTIDTWLSWRLVSGTVLNVGVVNSQKYPDKLELIKEVVLSEESIEIDDSLLHKGPQGSTSVYYIGWAGALKQAAKSPTQFYIPDKLEVVESARGEGNITIILSDEKNGDGYSGYTKSIADDSQNQILKSTLTIFEVDMLSDEQFKTILRHELGHALGLAHSTAPEDLMAPTIQTQYPYISDCDISSIIKLYDGGKKSQVTCEK